MDEKKYRLSGEMSLAVPVDDADALLRLGDGNAALLYLYALRRGGAFSPVDASRDLNRSEKEIENAMDALRRGGLISDKTAVPSGSLPQYAPSDIVARSRESGEFQAIIEETQRVVGRTLSGADMNTLFGIYDNLALPAEVICLLEHHCEEETRKSRGPGARPSMRAIETEASRWFNREILTLERAEEYLKQLRERSEDASVVKRVLQIGGRALTVTEKKYIDSWLDMGFTPEVIALAYDRTVVNTGSLQWKYMNSILRSWDEKKLRTPEEIEAGDTKGGRAPSSAAPTAQGAQSKNGTESDRLRRMMDKL